MFRHIVPILFTCFLATGLFGQTFDLLKDKDKVTIPFEYRQNFILVKIELENSLPLHFIFDTGAEYTLLFKQTYAEMLNLSFDGTIRVLGSDLSRDLHARISRTVQVKVPPLESIKTDILVLNQDYLYLDRIVGKSIDGILGANFFHDHVVRIDYKEREITLYKPNAFQRPGKKFTEHELEIRRKKPYITFELNPRDDRSLPVELLVDSGAGISFMLHSNTDTAISRPDSTILGQLGAGLGGYLSGYFGKVHSLSLNDELSFRDIVVSFQDLDSSLVANREFVRNGLIGNVVLSRFELIIDYPGRRIFLAPGKKYDRAFKYDRSGLIIFATGEDFNQYYVKAVIPGSPADQVDIRPGDKLKWFQCFPASWYSLEGVLKRLKQRGDKKIRLSLIRDGEKLKKTVHLRDLF